MKLKSYIYIIVSLCFFILFSVESKAQSNVYKQNNIDSAAINNRVKQEYVKRDSILNAMKLKRIADSFARVVAKQQLQNFRDSLIKARNDKRIADSIARVAAKQKLIDDRRIKDSIDFAIKRKIEDSIALAKFNAEKILEKQRRITDSIANERKRVNDSLIYARKQYNDSVNLARIEQKKIREELAKYKNSKQYKDSLATAKKDRADSIKMARSELQEQIKNERIRVLDSIKTAREHTIDSLSSVKQQYNDSVKTAQTAIREKLQSERDRISDSISTIRNKRKDSLAAIREKNEKKATESAKEKSKEKLDKALAIKIHDTKKEDWTNEKLLKRKWSLPRKIYQNTVTRYNYYYNAKRKYDESIKDLTKKNKDDFTKIINISPYNFEKDGSSVASNMDSVIKKSSFSTQIHDPRSKWFDNLYNLMGKAYFVKNDYDEAIASFQFVANEYKEKPKKTDKSAKTKGTSKNDPLSIATKENYKGIHKFNHKPVRNQALVWLAKSYIMAEQYSEAQSLISILEKDKNFPKSRKGELLLTKADLEIKQENKKEAITTLLAASKSKIPAKTKVRTEYILGQLYAQQNDYKSSTEHFKKSITRKSTPEMEFFAQMSIAQNAAKGGDDFKYAINQLEKIIADPKFEKYKSQALNTLALIQAKENPTKAIEILQKSIHNELNKDNFLKAVAFAELGKLYYDRNDYKLSKISYDSASLLGTNPPLENINEVNTRKEVLTKVVTLTDIIQLQDSLLKLSSMSEKDKRAAAKRELDRIKQEEKKAIEAPLQVVALQPQNQNQSQSNWYFYNNSLIQKGSTEFKQKWGNRKLEDNWRRSAAVNAFSSNSNDGGDGDNEKEKEQENTKGIDALLALIPKTPADKDIANKKIMDAYFNLGLVYFSQLEDYKNSIKSYDTLISRYPTTDYKNQAYYGLYLDYLKLNNIPESDRYKQLINKEFGNSKLNEIASNPNYESEQKNLKKLLAEQYDSTYQLYKDAKYQEALNDVENAKTKKHPLIAKYELVGALCYASMKDFKSCKTNLQSVITNYPGTDEQKKAQEILSYIVSKDTTAIDSVTAKLINASNTKIEDSLEASEAFKELRNYDGKGTYILNDNSEHLVFIFVKNIDGKTMGLKAGLSDYNLLKHNIQEYSTGMNMLSAQQAIVTVQKFPNAVTAKKYLNEIKNEKLIFSQLKPNEYDVAIISQQNYVELLKTRDILGYMKFYKKNNK